MTRRFQLLTIFGALLLGQAAAPAQETAQETAQNTAGHGLALRPLNQSEAHTRRLEFAVAKSNGPSQTGQIVYTTFVAMGVDSNRRLNTVISAINTTNQKVQILIEFFGLDGLPLALPFQNANGALSGYYTGAAGELPPGVEAAASLLVRNEPAKYGWARITSDMPGALAVSSFVNTQDSSRTGVFVHKAAEPVGGAMEIGIENSPSTKATWLGIVNPAPEDLQLLLTARHADGSSACDVRLTIAPRQMIWKATQNLIPCERPGYPNYTLHIEPLNGEAVVQAYYDYGSLLYATAPVHEVMADAIAEPVAGPSAAAAAEAAAVSCRPTFDPAGLRLTADQQTIEVTMDFSACNPNEPWILRKAITGSTWFTLVDAQGRSISSITGKGTATFVVKVDAATARRFSGSRTGTIYLSSYTNGRAGVTVALYQFTQPIPKL